MNNDNNVLSNEEINDVEITEKDLARLLHSISYRKAYNKRPDVVSKRRERNRVQAAKMKLVREYLKQHPEVTL